MRDAKKLEATISDIAKATLQNERAVRRHEESGAFDLGDLLSVSRYVVGKRLLATGFDLIGEVVMNHAAPSQFPMHPQGPPPPKVDAPISVAEKIAAKKAKLKAYLETAPSRDEIISDESVSDDPAGDKCREYGELMSQVERDGWNDLSVEESDRIKELAGCGIDKLWIKRGGR